MKSCKIKLILLLLLVFNLLFAKEVLSTFVDDLKMVGKYAYKGSYLQFTTPNNLTLWGMGSMITGVALEEDEKWSTSIREGSDNRFNNVVSDVGILFNTPFFPVAFYYLGKKSNNSKMVDFSKEYMATLAVVLAETHLISIIPIHKRPSPSNANFFEKNFRYESSFPSGHPVGFITLGFKLWQFYGPTPALPFLMAATISSYQRVQSGKHYLSDVVASWVLSLMASEGVKIAARNEKRSLLTRLIQDHSLSVGYLGGKRGQGLQILFRY